MTYEDDLVCILECALRYRFFEHIMNYATERDSFDVSDLEKNTEEISLGLKSSGNALMYVPKNPPALAVGSVKRYR